ncbi:MAG: omptin family outer membrane protease [Thermodesulfobacteriota bacterium]
MNKKALALFVLATFLFSGSALARKPLPRFEANISGGYLDGDTTYEIGGRVSYPGGTDQIPFPISRLEFPFELGVAVAEGVYRPCDNWRLSVSGMKNFTDTGEDMKDSDWLYGNYGDPTLKDIYSHSQADADLYAIDAKLRYVFATAEERNIEFGYTGDEPDVRYTFFAGLGFRYENYHYDVHDVLEWYPNTPWIDPNRVSGPALKYDLDFMIPLGEIGCEFWWSEKLRVELSTTFSIFVHGSDKDQHLLRNRVSSFSSGWNGKYLAGTVRAQYSFCTSWFADLAVTGSRINADGLSHANDPNIGPFIIEEKVENVQALFTAGLGYRF